MDWPSAFASKIDRSIQTVEESVLKRISASSENRCNKVSLGANQSFSLWDEAATALQSQGLSMFANFVSKLPYSTKKEGGRLEKSFDFQRFVRKQAKRLG